MAHETTEQIAYMIHARYKQKLALPQERCPAYKYNSLAIDLSLHLP